MIASGFSWFNLIPAAPCDVRPTQEVLAARLLDAEVAAAELAEKAAIELIQEEEEDAARKTKKKKKKSKNQRSEAPPPQPTERAKEENPVEHTEEYHPDASSSGALAPAKAVEALSDLFVALSIDERLHERADAGCQTRIPTKNKSVTCVPDTQSIGTQTEDDGKCAACWETEPDMVLFPCKHLCLCECCGEKWRHGCPICRTHIESRVKGFRA